MAPSSRSYHLHQQHPPELAVRGDQISIMLVTVEKRTCERLFGFGASMSDDLYIISAFSDSGCSQYRSCVFVHIETVQGLENTLCAQTHKTWGKEKPFGDAAAFYEFARKAYCQVPGIALYRSEL